MSRSRSPYIIGDCWLDKRRDGRSPNTWQIARAIKRSVVYRSTHCEGLDAAKAAIEAFVAEQRARQKQDQTEAQVVPLLMAYWQEHGRKTVNHDQAARSIRTFVAFLAQDCVGARAVVTDLVPTTFERFREWRMGSHTFAIRWGAEQINYSSQGVSGATVQRNINDIRAAVHHAEDNQRIPLSPRIRDLPARYRSEPRDRTLTLQEMSRIAWFASHSPSLFRFVVLLFATAVRPDAALKFDPAAQYDPSTGLIDLHPGAAPQTKKRNAIVPAIRPLRPILEAWSTERTPVVKSRKTAWRNMRRTLCLPSDVIPKTIRHTVATYLHSQNVPANEIAELLGHSGGLARATRIYAKYRPEHLQHVTRALTTLWLAVSREARAFAADHLLTTAGQGGKLIVTRKRQEP